ncbi:alcohol dehydrogenase 1-like isoform X2 [Nicotiana tomentosiformis]|uniref:alcohol dehydrogenase 1-like isoform X2 n=1 Tax=Nicotiana tomentosiformis TaxID=4098 RepID=UPI00388C8161
MGARQTITDQGSGDGTSKKKMEVRLKILYAFLRYTDIYFWEAKEQNSVFPRILGHEASVYLGLWRGSNQKGYSCAHRKSEKAICTASYGLTMTGK